MAAEVRRGRVDDCEALAIFAESVQPPDLERMVGAFNLFIPRSKANYPLGWPIDLIGTEDPIRFEGRVSGYRSEFRAGYEPGRLE